MRLLSIVLIAAIGPLVSRAGSPTSAVSAADEVLYEKSLESGSKLIVTRTPNFALPATEFPADGARAETGEAFTVRASLRAKDSEPPIVLWTASFKASRMERPNGGITILDAVIAKQGLVIAVVRRQTLFLYRQKPNEWGDLVIAECTALRSADWLASARGLVRPSDLRVRLELSNSGRWAVHVAHQTVPPMHTHFEQAKDKWEFVLTSRDGKSADGKFGAAAGERQN
jgi:hypothetical protein